jgi:hypothetical protein
VAVVDLRAAVLPRGTVLAFIAGTARVILDAPGAIVNT